jgi:LacI family transcriptional regulator
MVTLKDLAQRVNRSVTTVSRALAGYSDVSPKTRELVAKAAEDMGYIPNTMAQRLQKSSTDTLGIILPGYGEGFSEPFFTEFLAGIGKMSSKYGYDLLVTYVHTRDELATYKKMIVSRRVDGFIIVRTLCIDERVKYLCDTGFPFAAFGRVDNGNCFPFVDEDGEYAMELIADHLAERNHTRIGVICPPQFIRSAKVRLTGLKKGLKKHGIKLDSDLIQIGSFDQKGGYEHAKLLLGLPNPPSAIVGFNDMVAMGAIHAAHDIGLEIGKDIAITGFDDIPMAEFCRPPLTTIRQPINQIGGMVTELLIQRIKTAGDTDIDVQQTILKPELIIRESSGG